MRDEVKERLAKEFAVAIRQVREEKWTVFSEAADQSGIDPYIALGVLLVRMVEQEINKSDPTWN